MIWEPLAERLSALPALPLVVAGPILRHTTGSSVSLWLAVLKPCELKLRIERVSDHALMFESEWQKALSFGDRLSIGVVTAKAKDHASELTSGTIYGYTFSLRVDGKELGMAADGVLSPGGGSDAICYPGDSSPTFALAPGDLGAASIAHGSCRRPHAPGADALAALDSLICDSRKDAYNRPHLLFMTGDQIYADDVADALLAMLMDAARTLLAPHGEVLPGPIAIGGGNQPRTSDDLQPGSRSPITMRAGLTAAVRSEFVPKSHLISLGEYLCMYLFVWSPVLWGSGFPSCEHAWRLTGSPSRGLASAYAGEVGVLSGFANSLRAVRRALANVPTYMIMDDHEITDDWYMFASWTARVLDGEGATGPRYAAFCEEVEDDEADRLERDPQPTTPIEMLGRRIIANGLSAYAVCQAWGNTPDVFTGGDGRALLSAVSSWARGGDAGAQAAEPYLLPPAGHTFVTSVRGNFTFHDIAPPPHPIDWHYVLRFSGFEIVVLDTRTMRAYADGTLAPQLISDDGIARQLGPLSGKPALIAIVPSPVFGCRNMEHAQLAAIEIGNRYQDGWEYKLDYEAWGVSDRGTIVLLNSLAEKAPQGPGGARQQRIVMLSGDVHYGFTTACDYRVHAKYPDGNLNARLSIAVCNSSAFKNKYDIKALYRVMGNYCEAILGREPVKIAVFYNLGGGSLVVGHAPSVGGTQCEVRCLAEPSFLPLTSIAHLVLTRTPEVELTLWNAFDRRPNAQRVAILEHPPASLSDSEFFELQWAANINRGLVTSNHVARLWIQAGGRQIVHELWWPLLERDHRSEADAFGSSRFTLDLEAVP